MTAEEVIRHAMQSLENRNIHVQRALPKARRVDTTARLIMAEPKEPKAARVIRMKSPEWLTNAKRAQFAHNQLAAHRGILPKARRVDVKQERRELTPAERLAAHRGTLKG